MLDLESKFLTCGDGKTAYFSHEPGGAKIGVVIVHGIAEHKGRYLDFIERLAAAGLAVFAPDLRGHGESDGARGDIERFEDYLSDLDTFVRQVRVENPGIKLALFGHSMGGLIACAYAGRQSSLGLVDALILSSPAVQRRPYLAPLKIMPKWALGKIKIRKYWSESAKMMGVATADPMGVMHFTLRLIQEAFVRGVDIAAKGMKNIRVPVLIVGGVGDQMTGGFDRVLLHMASVDKTLRIYEKAIHRVVQNAAADEAIPEIIEWIKGRLLIGAMPDIIRQGETMDIFLCINEKYVKFALITIVSVMENHPDGRVAFHVIGADISNESKRKFEKLTANYKNLAIDFAVPDLGNFAGFKNDDPNLGLETYIRFLIPDLYPEIDKGLYIDVDLIATKSIAPLWNTDISRHLGAGVRAPRIDANLEHKRRLGIAAESLYINAGVMLMNLAQMRAEGVKEKLFAAALAYKKVIRNPSQDPTNIVFEGRLAELPARFNFTNVHRQKSRRREINDAAVYHYTGAKKPWNHKFSWLHKLNIPGFKKPEYYMWHKYNRINERIQAGE